MNKVNGIALIQVLLFTAILTVFAIYLNQTAKQQVSLAQMAKKRAEAELLLKSAHSTMLFNLLTNDKIVMVPNNGEEESLDIKSIWNFHGQPFKLNQFVEVEMQDLAGLLNLHKPNINLLNKLLVTNGISPIRARVIIDHLLDWQDSDNDSREFGRDSSDYSLIRNAPLSHLSEINKIIQLTDEEKKLIMDNSTIHYIGHFNPLSASIELIRSITKNIGSESVIKRLRESNQLDRSKFVSISGIRDSDEAWLVVANTLQIKYKVTVGQIVMNKEYTIKLQPYASQGASPYLILSERN